jgi:hypothetical protein
MSFMQKCFVIQPFDRDVFDSRYKDIFKSAIEEAGYVPYRVDEGSNRCKAESRRQCGKSGQ